VGSYSKQGENNGGLLDKSWYQHIHLCEHMHAHRGLLQYYDLVLLAIGTMPLERCGVLHTYSRILVSSSPKYYYPVSSYLYKLVMFQHWSGYQEPVLFLTTIAKSICYGRNDFIEEMVTIAEAASAHLCISQLLRGWVLLSMEWMYNPCKDISTSP